MIEVELIFVDAGTRSAIAIFNQAAVELEEGAKVPGEVHTSELTR